MKITAFAPARETTERAAAGRAECPLQLLLLRRKLRHGMTVFADALLREYRRENPGRAGTAGGRRLHDGSPCSERAAWDFEDLEWAEQQLAHTSLLAERPVIRAAKTASISELTKLEGCFRAVQASLSRERAAITTLQTALQNAGIERSSGAQLIKRGDTPATVSVCPEAGPTTASALQDAMLRRIALLRAQLLQSQEELEATTLSRAALEELASGAGVVVESETADSASAIRPEAMLAQLARLNGALREATRGRKDGERGKGHRNVVRSFSKPPDVPISVFSDGFMLFRGPFRKFESDEARMFAAQVMSGMMPHELNQRFPDGCLFEIHDVCHQTHAQAHALAVERQRPCGGGSARVVGVDDMAGAAPLLAPQRAEDLLRRLPQTVVRTGGTVVPVRSELAQVLGVPLAPTPVPQDGSSPSDAPEPDDMRAARLRRFAGAGVSSV